MGKPGLDEISINAAPDDIQDDQEESKTEELPLLQQDPFEVIRTTYVAPARYDPNTYYDLESLRKFEASTVPLTFISDGEFKSDFFWIENDYYFKWMELLCMMERNMKAILLNKMTNPEDVPNFITKKVIPLMNSVMGKLILNESQLKIQIYCNEIILMAQRVALAYLKQYPQPCLSILKKIFTNQNERLYDSRFQNNQINPAIQDFYAERAYIGLSSELKGVLRPNAAELTYNTHQYYPLQDEILADYKKNQSSFYFSPLLRIQVHVFYLNNGFGRLAEIINAPDWSIPLIMEMLDIMSSFHWLLNQQIYNGFLQDVHQSLLRIPEKISEEELKNSNKDQFYTLLSNLKKILQPLYSAQDLDRTVGLIEMQIIMLCFRSQNLEKRIYGLQQFCDKINEALNNEYLQQTYNQYQGMQQQQSEWVIPKNILDFLVEHQIFEELFGEKSHIELIKRSFPLVRFLYQQNRLGEGGVINLLAMVKGKHEAWVNIMYKILNEMAEVLLEKDIEEVLDQVSKYTMDVIDGNVINFIKSFGKNPIFEKAESKALKRVRKTNTKSGQQQPANNVLDEMDLESRKDDPEENISNLICKNKDEQLVIKIHNNMGEETPSYDYGTMQKRSAMPEIKICPPPDKPTDRKPGERFHVAVGRRYQHVQDSGSDDTEEEEFDSAGIRLSGRILNYLSDLLKRCEDFNTDQSKLLFSVFTHLLCNSFKFQRFNYMVHSINALSEPVWAIPPTIHITILQKVIQSSYPIINVAERCLLKSQGEITKWVESQYNFKMSALGWISRIKKQCIERLVSRMEDDNILGGYYDQIEQLLKFYQLFYTLQDGQKIEQNQIRLLWQILVENALSPAEHNVFFSWLHSIMYASRTLNKVLILSPECVQLVFFEYLIKIHHSSYQVSMFFCLHDLILHFNIQYKLLKPLNDHDNNMVMSHELIGLEVVWHLFFESQKPEIVAKAQEFLLQLIRFRTNSEEVQNNLKEHYTQKIMLNIQQKVWDGDNLESISRSLDLLTKMLEDLEGLSMGKASDKGEKITVIVDNKIKTSMPPKKQDITLFTGMTVLAMKQHVGQRLNPAMKPEEFDVVNRGIWLSDGKTLKEYGFENKVTIMIYQKSKSDDEQQRETDGFVGTAPAIALPYHTDEQAAQEKIAPDQHTIDWKVQTICDFSGEDDKDFVRFVLEEKNFNEEDVINEFLDPSLKETNLVKFQIKRSQQKTKQQVPEDTTSSISTMISENVEHISTLFKVLQINDPTIGPKVWQILSLIPRNRQIYQAVERCLYETERRRTGQMEEEGQPTWDSLLDAKNTHRLLYNLQILKELLQCDIIEDQAVQDVRHRREGRERFIWNGGLANIVELFMNPGYLSSVRGASEYDTSSQQIKVVSLTMEMFSMYSNAYVLSKCPQKQGEITKLINLRDTLKEVYLEQQQSANYFMGGVLKSKILSSQNSNTISSAVTPAFQSVSVTPQNIPTPPIIPDEDISGKGSQQQASRNKTDEFKQLVQAFQQEKRLQLAYEEVYQTIVENGHLIRHCIDVIKALENHEETAEQAFSLMLTNMHHQPTLVQDLYNVVGLTDVFLGILQNSPNEGLRRMIAFTIMTICDMVSDEERFILKDFVEPARGEDEIFLTASNKIRLKDPRIFFLKAYVPLINDYDFGLLTSEDLFVVIANLLSSLDAESLRDIVHFEQLFEKVTQVIINRHIVEDRFGENEDKVLQGYLLLLTTILQINPQFKQGMHESLHQIYDFLFYMPSIEKIESNQAKKQLLQFPKCKRKLTRKRAFQLLIEACTNQEENFIALLNPIVKNHERFDHNEAEASNINVKGSHGYVGLKNMGCTCYINSLLQQFFMMPYLRREIINAQLSIPNNESYLNEFPKAAVTLLQQYATVEGDYLVLADGYAIEEKRILKLLFQDNTLYQLQQVFAQLQESVKQFIIPNAFIASIKGYDGQQINVVIQQDVNEFFNLVTDKLETNLKGTNQANLLQRSMGGVLGHALVSLEEEYPYERESDEPFLTVTIEIKNKRNLEEALDLFVKGDVLEGENKYFCEQYDRKINAVKHCYFKELPDTFMITLKRFEFDYTSMIKMKVNDYFEFPMEISLYKWTKEGQRGEGQPKPEHLYTLQGVLVHSGSAESGHYYSFIRDRQNDAWFEFNDTQISAFNLVNLKAECFGGGESSYYQDWDNQNRSKNAYILFYERVSNKIVEEPKEQCLVEKVWQENLIFLRNLMFYSADYLCFVKDFICQFKFPEQLEVKDVISYDEEMLALLDDISETLVHYQDTPAMKVIKLMTLFSYETLIKNNDVQGFVNSMQTIQTLYDKFVPGAFWLLGYCSKNKQILIDLVFENSHAEVKHHFAKLLTSCIQCVARVEESYLLDDIDLGLANDQYQQKERYKKSCLLRFLNVFIDQLFPTSKKNMRRSTEYYQIIQFTMVQSPKLIELAVDVGTFRTFYNFFCDTLRENQSHFPLSISKLNEKGIENSMVALFEVLTKIITGSVTQGMVMTGEDSPTYLFKPFTVSHPKLDRVISNLILTQDHFKQYFVPMMQLNNSVVEVAKHLCWGDRDSSQRLMKQMMTLILDYFITWHQTEPVFRIVDSVLKLNDQFQRDRVEMFFTPLVDSTLKANSLVDAIRMQITFEKNYSLNAIKWIAEIGFNCAPFADYMVMHHETFKDMLTTLRNQRSHQQHQTMLDRPQILPNIINKCIGQLEQILNLQKWEEPRQSEPLEIQIEDLDTITQSDQTNDCIHNLLNQSKSRYNKDEPEIENIAQKQVHSDYQQMLQGMEQDSDNDSKRAHVSDDAREEDFDGNPNMPFEDYN